MIALSRSWDVEDGGRVWIEDNQAMAVDVPGRGRGEIGCRDSSHAKCRNEG